ncbi:hypothetical protein CORC01_11923 [Colletotrichum orchidophilum]|uniref:Uncharacterized protein n=1 Tax=Colletotrichum orchidophilum TaxID=1209926 RepID=A0A1G4AUL1_9PEZI|nr:uncharacterized protein CORC01_11923 [Colletotrichum orchidophilum]OHE92773.1 hypothetical protein CORC01_11923 [Colletotrichum orchidophilum]
MTRNTRSSTICEWALGFSVEDYCNSIERRRRKKSSSRQRICVEISTDDESEEDTVKITYPRANRSKDTSISGTKKVRFDKMSPKSALKAKDSEAESKEKKKSSKTDDTSDSESESKSKKKKGDKSAKEKVVESSSESEESETETTETESETDESDDETPAPPKKKKTQEKTKDRVKKSFKTKESVASADIEPNNVGPTIKKVRNKNGGAKSDATKKASEPQKLRPEAVLSPHLRRPNLIMPIRAEVVQIEHTIEGVEDPRPNAFHDPQHGVVRVYHGPAYGNPYGLLYPTRDPNNAPLPMGVPHPLQNPYFHGFANPANPGDNHFKRQSPWGAMPVTCMPGGPPVMAAVDPMQTSMQIPPWWGPMSPKTLSPKGSPKPVMSGAILGDAASTGAKDKEKGWDTNVGPQQSKAPSPPTKTASPNNVAPASPININLTVNPNTPWAAFAGDLSKKSTPNKNGSQVGSKVNGGGSNGSKNSWGSKKTTDWQPLSSGQHPDLAWGNTPTKSQGSNKGSNSAWTKVGDANNNSWGGPGGSGSNNGWNTTSQNDDAWGTSGNTQGHDAQTASGGDGWTTTNDTTWGNTENNNYQAATMKNDGWGAPIDLSADAWTNSGGDYGNNWGNGSNHSGSKKSDKSHSGNDSNRSTSGQAQPATNWDGQGNNVGCSGSGRKASNSSNKSNKSKKSSPPQTSTDAGWDNNAGPTANNSPQNSQTAKKSSRSKDKTDQWVTAGGGAGWGPETTNGEVNWGPTATEMSKASSSSKSMPGAWDANIPPWGDPTLAQSTGGAADGW